MTPERPEHGRSVDDDGRGTARLERLQRAAHAIVDMSPQGLAILQQGRVVFANPQIAAISGTTVPALLAASPADVRACFGAPVLAGLEGAPKAQWHPDPLQVTGPDGRTRFFKLRVDPMVYEGAPAHRLAVADVTEHVHLEMQLRQAQKLEAIGQLAAGIAHEINTPTQFVGDNLQFLGDAWGDLAPLIDTVMEVCDALRAAPETAAFAKRLTTALKDADVAYLKDEVPRALAQSRDGVGRVAKIVRAMKEFSHPGGDEKTDIDVNHAIDTTITVARNEWKYVADVVTDFAPAAPPVPCLPGEFNQVILNLLINAAHAVGDAVQGTDEKGRITVGTKLDGDWMEIWVADTGVGIPESLQARIFEPFFTTKEVGKGTGQGLALAHTVIVQRHGGHLWCESQPGKGTRFTIRLPLTDTQSLAEVGT